MGTLQKSQTCHEQPMELRYLPKNSDFQLLNGLDHQHEANRSRSGKMMIFDPKIVRIDRNRKNERLFKGIVQRSCSKHCSKSCFVDAEMCKDIEVHTKTRCEDCRKFGFSHHFNDAKTKRERVFGDKINVFFHVFLHVF